LNNQLDLRDNCLWSSSNAKQLICEIRFGVLVYFACLWFEQRGLCVLCNERITRITGWRLHPCVPRVLGGSTSAENRVLLHPECHSRVHRQRLHRGNSHAHFLEGRTGAILSGYSVRSTGLTTPSINNLTRQDGRL
jgi:5-methylcytosine-specific restriction endonuclease McrA